MIKYDYIIKISVFLRLYYVLGVVAWLVAAYGISRLFMNPFFWLMFAIPFFLISANRIFNFIMIAFFYKKFSLTEHKNKRESFFSDRGRDLPSVDIFIPNVGEEIAVLRNSYEGISNITYEGDVLVHCLDDAGRKDVELLAQEFGFNYVNRPNAGEMKKAGNLRYSYERTSGDYIVVFDADVRPAADFLLETLPYMDTDVGILQTPQNFPMTKNVNRNSLIEWQAGDIQQDFYRLVQPSRDRFCSAICVGTNAVYSRRALFASGGFAQVDRSEDVFTGLKTTASGFRVKYIPLILAVGYNPPTVEGFFRQHNRWCSGSVKLAFSKLMWSKEISNINRVFYLSGSLNYFSAAMSVIFAFHVWIIILFHANDLSIDYLVYFLPSMVFQLFMPLTRVYRSVRSFTRPLIGNIQKYTYFYSYWMLLRGANMGWTATAESGHSRNDFFMSFVGLVFAVCVLNLLAAVYFVISCVAASDYQVFTYPIVLYFFYSFYANFTLFLISFREYVGEEVSYDFERFSIESINLDKYKSDYVPIIMSDPDVRWAEAVSEVVPEVVPEVKGNVERDASVPA